MKADRSNNAYLYQIAIDFASQMTSDQWVIAFVHSWIFLCVDHV